MVNNKVLIIAGFMLVVILVEHQGYTAIIRDNFSEDEPLKKDDAAAINYEERDNGCREMYYPCTTSNITQACPPSAEYSWSKIRCFRGQCNYCYNRDNN